MTESLLPAAIRLTTTAEALAALAAHVRVETEGLDIDPRIGSLLAAIATELTGSMATAESVAGPQVVGMARAFLRDSVNLVDDPGRTGGWSTVDPGSSRRRPVVDGHPPVFALAAGALPGLAEALAAPSARFLDVGTGTGWLAIATARTFPAAHVVGIDVFEPALALARGNVTSEGLAERVSLRQVDVTALDDSESYDAVWLPLPFLAPSIVPAAVEAARRALRPGGWLLPGTFAGGDDPLSRLLIELRIVRSGGHPWAVDELVGMLTDNGLSGGHEIPRTWPAPLRLFAAQRPPAP